MKTLFILWLKKITLTFSVFVSQNSEFKPRVYTESQAFFGGLIHGEGERKGGGDLYLRWIYIWSPIVCLELFTPVICILRKRNGIR